MIRSLLAGIGGIILILLAWQFAPITSGQVELSVYRGFATLAAFAGEPENFAAGLKVVLWNAAQSLLLVLGGIAIASPLAMLTGIGLARLREAVPISGAPLLVLRAVPLIGLVPLFERWFGDMPASRYLYVAFATWVLMASTAFFAAASLDQALLDAATVYGVKESKLWRAILLPGIQRELLGSYQILMGYIWAFALAAEFLSSGGGLGQLVIAAYQRSDINQLAALMITYLILGVVSISMVYFAIRAIPNLRLRDGGMT